ncbi:hypothetical protein CBR_g3625 [Chara braunii]|uniref:DUF2237 domain-containing protein n=1 Tax=Chara braunii TaxID=69332 RepID=A0A388KFX8_CHABU|nr:hypothetical protein CBR_g3625 [Chara braunii]|eukprot:GBG68926.1 hypothetical protein CBR_g3625 [Chara braunii]
MLSSAGAVLRLARHHSFKSLIDRNQVSVFILSRMVAVAWTSVVGISLTRGAFGAQATSISAARAMTSSSPPSPSPSPSPFSPAMNVNRTPLKPCCMNPRTGFYRNGFCETGAQDFGTHTVCAQVTREFLEYTRSLGNDLMTPRPEYSFPGLKPGDKWCLCASRWREAMAAGVAPPVDLDATHARTLEYVTKAELEAHSVSLAAKTSASTGAAPRGGAAAGSQQPGFLDGDGRRTDLLDDADGPDRFGTVIRRD